MFSKWILARRAERPCHGDRRSVLIGAIVLSFGSAVALVSAQGPSPHFDPVHGVKRVEAPWAPVGDCAHCHNMKSPETGGPPNARLLFAENTNTMCYTPGGAGPCHAQLPDNYPADETSRIPEGFPDAGYFEDNTGGARNPGVQYRSRWPGALVYDDPAVLGSFSAFASPHRNDPDMPRLDSSGRGSCLNCHDAHESQSPFDMLLSPYHGIGGYDEPTYPTRYQLCFDCHSAFGPSGMNFTGRQIADYYDSSMNGDHAGHQIRMNNNIAISWPSHVRVGDKLPCYDCHNAHGSRGYNNEGANANLISDERPGWSNLTDTRTDPVQSRRFCLGCHIPSDGFAGSQVVEGIVMNAIPSEDGHLSTDPRGCFECHGADYSNSQSYNVHNPGN